MRHCFVERETGWSISKLAIVWGELRWGWLIARTKFVREEQ